jgi:hypothetical protein
MINEQNIDSEEKKISRRAVLRDGLLLVGAAVGGITLFKTIEGFSNNLNVYSKDYGEKTYICQGTIDGAVLEGNPLQSQADMIGIVADYEKLRRGTPMLPMSSTIGILSYMNPPRNRSQDEGVDIKYEKGTATFYDEGLVNLVKEGRVKSGDPITVEYKEIFRVLRTHDGKELKRELEGYQPVKVIPIKTAQD